MSDIYMPMGFLQILGQADAGTAAETFYRQFFVSGGPIVWFVLLPMSVVMVYLAIDLLIMTRRSRLLPAGLSSEIATLAVRHGLMSLPSKLAGRADLMSRALLLALEQGRGEEECTEKMRHAAAESLQESGLRLSRKPQWLQLIGTIAPMVGLFGTVYGMICAFNLLGRGTEGPRYEMLADSISVALVTTFWGLLVAIPAQFCYAFFQGRLESSVSEAAIETDALLGRLYANGLSKTLAIEQKPITPEPAGTGASETASNQVRAGTFVRRKQRRIGIIVQRPAMKRPSEE